MPTADVGSEAEASANAAASGSGLRLVELATAERQEAAAELFCRVWGADSPDRLINVPTMRALALAGSYLVGAYSGTELVGAAVGLLGLDHLHSHITGVAGSAQGGGVGYALKLHQRAWALSRGLAEVRWTFDPLVRRNAYFNLHKLGASVVEYLPDFYGAMDDGVNTGDATDRLYVHWRLASPRAVAAAHGDPAEVDTAALREAGAVVRLDRRGEEPGRLSPVRGNPLLVAVPPDIEGLRVDDPLCGARWRYAVRDALGGAMAEGYRVTGISRNGFYVLERA